MPDVGPAAVALTDIDRPPVAPGLAPDALPLIREANSSGSWWTLVLDDDPTGTQTTHSAPVLMADWSEPALEWACAQPGGLTFALTNSRSLDPAEAGGLTRRIIRSAAAVVDRLGRRLRVISRSDSTLRGHVGVEIHSAVEALASCGRPVDVTLFVPCFLEAGRYTADDVQWVRTGAGTLTAAADTEFAKDTTFGYGERTLTEFLARRLQRDAGEIGDIPLAHLRSGDAVRRVGERLAGARPGEVIIASAVRHTDLDVLMLGLQRAEAAGRRVLVRSGPSFVRACAGLEPSTAMSTGEIYAAGTAARHGLVVVGSHTDLTNRQLAGLHGAREPLTVELDVPAVLASADSAAAEVARCHREVVAGLTTGTVVLRTSRVLAEHDAVNPLVTTRAVAAALTGAVRAVVDGTPLRFLVAKGGITSSDIATSALGATRAVVAGQMFPGLIPVWRLADGRRPGLPYVVFPGNVGSADALASVVDRLT